MLDLAVDLKEIELNNINRKPSLLEHYGYKIFL